MIAVLIPTRHRDILAMNAVRTLQEQDCAIEIFVSDNSAAPGALQAFCRRANVHYLRSARELPVAEHWDWALHQLLEHTTATHVMLQHDRKWTKPRSLGAIEALAARRPETLITFGTDAITEIPPPRRLWQMPWTGRTFRIRTARAASVIAQARVAESSHALPILATCIVPRSVLHAMAGRFGDICRSTGPDIAFMARFLALYDDYLHFDAAPGILYAAHRSTNMGYFRGSGGDFADFLKLHGERAWLDAAPVPGLTLGSNMLFHEYELVRRATGDRLPPLDRDACLRELAAGLQWVAEPRRSALARALGVQPGLPAPARTWRATLHEKRTLLRARLGGPPPAITGFAFRNDATALRHALRYPRARQESHEHLDLLEPEEVR